MLRCPPALVPGDGVRVVAPSSPFDRRRFDLGHECLGARYSVTLADGLFARTGFLAGDDQARARALKVALRDEDVRALIAARGGYGATRLLPWLEVDEVRSAGRWLVGFSDTTALHALWARAGLCSIHGPMVCSLAEAPDAARQALFALLEGGTPAPWSELEVVREGRAEGRLLGGNLTVLAALAGTPFMPSLSDAILIVEDVTERPYRLDRMLTTLLGSGALDGVRGVIIGHFTECEPGPDGTRWEEVLHERFGTLGVPIVAGAPVGHVDDNMPVVLGAHTIIEGDRVRFVQP
jgi:muramoyltetrapeptide carboxypeptidase